MDHHLWHGGAPDRRVGDLLLPPTETGLEYTRAHMSVEAGLGEIAQRPDRVYVTTNRDLARAYAGLWTPDGVHHGKGALYRVAVEPDDLEPDEDLLSLPGVSFQARQATVLSVYDACVLFDPKYGRVFEQVLSDHKTAKNSDSD